ncbi:MAG: quinoprotein relay system zinc metallohydrolase 2 [Alphaproteobacteria bacterium]
MKLIVFIFICLINASSFSFDFDEVADGIYVHYGYQEDSNENNKGDIANVGFIIGSESIAVIDTGGTPNIGKKMKKRIREISDLPITHIIITHSHPDHIFGTEVFINEKVKILGHEKLKRALLNNFEFYRNLQFNLIKEENIKNVNFFEPNQSIKVNETLSINIGDRELLIKAWPSGHTDNDLSVYDKKTNFFWSENIFVNRIPSIRASTKGWLSNLKEISKMNIKMIIPGHGPVSEKKKALEPMISYFERLINETRKFHKNNQTLKEAQRKIASKNIENWILFDEYHVSNVTKTYTELEWE